MQTPELAMEGVCQRVTLGMMAQQPLEADFFPGILEGLVSRLGLAPPGVANPPTSVREGMPQCWATALREALKETKRGVMDPRQDSIHGTPHGLHLDYSVDFQSRRLGDVAPTFLSPLLPKQVGNILLLERAPSTAGPPESHPQQASTTEGIPEFQPAQMPTPEDLPDSILEQVPTPEEPPSFIQEGDQVSPSESKTESRPILKVKFLFHHKTKETPESLEEESTSHKDAPSKVDQEVTSVVMISDKEGMTQEAPGPSTSQSTEVSGCKQCLEGQVSASESSTPKK